VKAAPLFAKDGDWRDRCMRVLGLQLWLSVVAVWVGLVDVFQPVSLAASLVGAAYVLIGGTALVSAFLLQFRSHRTAQRAAGSQGSMRRSRWRLAPMATARSSFGL
jgi:hypothetical protein